MGDSLVGRQSDAKKTEKSHSETALLADWRELDKKAVKASDDDISKLTKSLQSSWTDVSTLAKIACLDTQVKSKSTLEQLAEKGPVKIDAATKMAFKTGELSIEAIATKIGNVGADLMSWFFGNGNAAKPEASSENPNKDASKPESKTEAPKAGDKAGLQPVAPPAGDAKPKSSAGGEQSVGDHKTDDKHEEVEEPQGLAASVLKGIEPQHLKQIFNTIFSKESKATALAILPDALINSDGIIFGVIEKAGLALGTSHKNSSDLASIAKPAEKAATATPEKPPTAPEIKIENGKPVFINHDRTVSLEREPDGSLHTTVRNKDTGVVGEMFAGINGSRVYKEGDRQIYQFLGKDKFTAGEFKLDGTALTQERGGKKVLVASKDQVAEYLENMVFVSDKAAKTLEEALANYKKAHPEETTTDDTMMIWYQNGGALIHPSLERMLEFKRTDEGIELNYDLGNGTHLRRSPKGKLFIIESDNTVKELSDEQKKKLIEGLGAKAEVVRKLLHSMETGKPIVLPDGQEISVENNTTIKSVKPNSPSADGKERKPTEVLMTSEGWSVNSPDVSSTFDQKTGQLTTEAEGKPVSIDLNSEHFDMVTDDFVRKDGQVTFVRTKVVLGADGAVDLPDGTKINAHNDVRFADGSTLSHDGKFVSADGTNSLTPLPHKSSLDAFVSQALSMATSAAARVQSGSCSPSDMALIEANMSVVQNFINLFSIAGNLPMAHSLYRSWSILNETRGKAQNEISHNEAAEKTREDEIRAFLNKLTLENKESTSRLVYGDSESVSNAA